MTDKVHYYWLDTMRFVAAFMVLSSHSRNTFFLLLVICLQTNRRFPVWPLHCSVG